MHRVGVVGVGNMGLAMALRLLELGHRVVVRDIDPGRETLAHTAGAQVAPTAEALARMCDAVVIAVVDAAQTEDVLFGTHGVEAGLPAGRAVLLCPTIAPADTERFARRLATCGIDCIDAPMSGGPARARAGRRSLMVACEDVVYDRWSPLLSALADPVFRVGARAGDGARTKLVNNLLAAVNLAGAAEALALAERLGLDAGRMQAVIERSSGQSWIGSDRMSRALAGDLAPRAHTALLRKDAALAVEMAEAARFEPRLGRIAADVFAAACEAGHAHEDDASLLPFLRAHDAGAGSAAATLHGAASHALDAALASRYADAALRALATPYPYALQHTARGPGGPSSPAEAHPLFHGSYDWHSSVHMQASLVHLARRVPTLPQRAAIEALLDERHRPDGVERERAHLEAHSTFERPYGWAWLLRLHDELHAFAPARAIVLDSLVALVRARWMRHLVEAPSPQRTGLHGNSAFAMTLALEHARLRADAELEAALVAAARRWYGDDRRYPIAYEPSANDFLSPGMCAAVLMQQALDADAFRRWWRDYRPEPLARWLAPAPVGSRVDAQLVHAEGLNLSRAWCLGRLASALPEEHERFAAARAAHLDAALPHVVEGDFVATHWLVSFALLALDDDFFVCPSR